MNVIYNSATMYIKREERFCITNPIFFVDENVIYLMLVYPIRLLYCHKTKILFMTKVPSYDDT